MSCICVVTTARNCVEWVERSIRSVQTQQGVEFKCVFIDDLSDDGTWERAQEVIGDDPRYTLMRPTTRSYALVNIMTGIQAVSTDENDIIAIVDGDDWLANPHVLRRVASVYSDPEVWMTYGNYTPYAPARKRSRGKHIRLIPRRRRGLKRGQAPGIRGDYPEVIRRERLYRHFYFLANHLRTHRRYLFDAIRDKDLRGDDGAYLKIASDAALMIPMLEMAGSEHARFISEILYIYNCVNEESDHRVHADAQNLTAADIVGRPCYPRLRRE